MPRQKISDFPAADSLPDEALIPAVIDGTTYKATAGQMRAPLAPLQSPAFTGTPSAPTAGLGTNTTQIATTAFVMAAVAEGVGPGAAPLASPAFTGTPTAPTAPGGTNTTQIASTAFVHSAITTVSDQVAAHVARTITLSKLGNDGTGAIGSTRPFLTAQAAFNAAVAANPSSDSPVVIAVGAGNFGDLAIDEAGITPSQYILWQGTSPESGIGQVTITRTSSTEKTFYIKATNVCCSGDITSYGKAGATPWMAYGSSGTNGANGSPGSVDGGNGGNGESIVGLPGENGGTAAHVDIQGVRFTSNVYLRSYGGDGGYGQSVQGGEGGSGGSGFSPDSGPPGNGGNGGDGGDATGGDGGNGGNCGSIRLTDCCFDAYCNFFLSAGNGGGNGGASAGTGGSSGAAGYSPEEGYGYGADGYTGDNGSTAEGTSGEMGHTGAAEVHLNRCTALNIVYLESNPDPVTAYVYYGCAGHFTTYGGCSFAAPNGYYYSDFSIPAVTG